MPVVEIVEADLCRTDHQLAVVDLLNSYAMDPMGDGKPLSDDVKTGLIPGLRQHPTTLIFLAYRAEEPVGIAVCFLGFSTFAARQLIYIEDLSVVSAYRGRGVGRHLLNTIEEKARALGCCRLALQVQENNVRARHFYETFGFAQTVYEEAAGAGLSMSKAL